MPVALVPGSTAATLYGEEKTEERYCDFGLNPEHQQALHDGGLRVSDAGGEARVLELPGHPFYLATLFVPQAEA
ncbi:hypothetical protein [Nonomuraea sp. NPDC048916]|uniref:hypothetical protein n=1 Tax=Nonomuraea sp. NPDC048916 TaxID=3154232 RepID=UPI0033FD00DD